LGLAPNSSFFRTVLLEESQFAVLTTPRQAPSSPWTFRTMGDKRAGLIPHAALSGGDAADPIGGMSLGAHSGGAGPH
jgi:hypothetical protein